MGRARIADRLDRVEGLVGTGEVRRIAARVAVVTGIAEVELMQEAERIAQVCQAQGITTVAGMTQYYAREFGISVPELEEELERIGALAA